MKSQFQREEAKADVINMIDPTFTLQLHCLLYIYRLRLKSPIYGKFTEAHLWRNSFTPGVSTSTMSAVQPMSEDYIQGK